MVGSAVLVSILYNSTAWVGESAYSVDVKYLLSQMSQRLAFAEEIISTAAQPIPTKELLTRLNDLHKELSTLEQDHVDLISLEQVKDDLNNKKLLKNTNKGVQIYVCCCLADILRLYAPDAPYDEVSLTSIFKLFLLQFSNLDDPESPFYEDYVYLIERVAEVKLIALMTDLSSKDKMITQIFENFYALSANKSFDNDSLQQILIDILNEVISEVSQLNLKVLKLILNKFLTNSKNLRNQSNIKVPGFDISLALCEMNSDKLSRFVTFFFSEMILEATKDNGSDLDLDSGDDDSDDASGKKLANFDMIQMTKIHNLAVELWRYVPEILTSVLGLLDNELEADDVRIRMIATSTVSKILAIQPSRVNFPTVYLSPYMNWLKKPLDISVEIRICWLGGLVDILEYRNDITSDVVNGLLKTMIDSNDKVRLNTIMSLSKLKPSTFLQSVVNGTLTDTLFKLLREKSVPIRDEVLRLLAALYNYSTGYDQYIKLEFIRKIPDNILKLVYINDNLINSEVDLALFEKLVPFNSDSSVRVNRLLRMLSLLSEKSKAAFFAIIKRQTQFSQVIQQILVLLDDETGDEDVEEQINNAIKWLSKSFPASHNSEFCLHHFIELKNKRFLRLLGLCSMETSDYDTIVNSMKELLNRIKDPKYFDNAIDKNALNLNDMYDTMKLLLLRCSNIFYNVSNLTCLVDINNDQSNDLNQMSKVAINGISEVCSNVLESHVISLIDAIVSRVGTISLDESRLTNDCWKDLKIIFNFTTQNKIETKFSSKFYDTLYDLSLCGTVLEAKYSIKIINNASGSTKGRLFTGLVHKIWPLKQNSPNFNTHLSTLATLFSCDSISVDRIKEDLSKFLASEVLLKNRNKEIPAPDSEENSEIDERKTWITDEELYYSKENAECLSKILSMKLLTNWLLNIKDTVSDDIELISKPILSMLSSYINRGGEIVATEDTPVSFCSRLRLHAGIQLLKIDQVPAYDDFIDQRRINRLILLIQDVESQVRYLFLNKLKKRLTQNKISRRFLALIFFIAHEPDSSLRSDTTTWIRASFAKQNTKANSKNSLVFEKSYIRLLYMLSTHPEFRELYMAYKGKENNADVENTVIGSEPNSESESELLRKFKEVSTFALTYIVFSLSLIMTSDNISLLYYLSQRIKQFEANSKIEGADLYPDSLYLISEFSQAAINFIGKIRNWNISIWPGKLILPADLFTKLDNESANNIIRTTYILDGLSDSVNEIIRNRWRNEQGVNFRKSKKKDVARIISPEPENPESRSIGKKSLKRVRNHSEEDNNSSDEYEGPKTNKTKENLATNRIRRSRRGRRVNYNEDN